MTTSRTIVAATDFSPGATAALERAVQVAQAHGAALQLLHAFDVSAGHSLKGIFDPQRLMTTNPPPDMQVQQRLRDLAAALATRTGLEVEARFSIGSVHSAIHAYATAHAPSLIVIGFRAEPAMPGLGSTASKVLRAPACPVLVVRSAASRPYDKVFSAVDMRDGSVRAAKAAISLFPAAHHHLLHAVELAWDPWRISGIATEQIPQILESMHAKATLELQQLAQDLSRLARHPVLADVADDVPARAVVAQAAALPADCVVVGHHGEGSTADTPLGSMAQHVLHHTLRDVLVVP